MMSTPISKQRLTLARRIRRNAAVVLSGNSLTAIIGLAALFLNTRALGSAGLGVLALITTYTNVIERICAFDTWQPMIKLGADALAAKDLKRLGALFYTALFFDIIGAMMAGAIALIGLWIFGDYVGVGHENLGPASLMAATLFVSLSGAATGLVRLLDHFRLLTYIQVTEAVVRLLITALLFLIGAGLSAYLVAYALVAASGKLALLLTSIYLAGRFDVTIAVCAFRPLFQQTWRELFAFSWVTSLCASINVLRQNADILVLGLFFGPTAVGVYHVANRISSVLVRAADPLQQAIYPEIAHLAALRDGRGIMYVVVQAGLLCGGVALLILILFMSFGERIIEILAGPKFGEAYWPLILLTSAFVLAVAGVGLRPAVLSVRKPTYMLWVFVVGFSAFSLIMPIAISSWGISGAGASQIAFNLVWFIAMAIGIVPWMKQFGQ